MKQTDSGMVWLATGNGMVSVIFKYIREGIYAIRTHSQLAYTVFLLIIIPLAFVINGQQFLGVALGGLERMEKLWIGTLQDVFADFVSGSVLADSAYIQSHIKNIVAQNPNISRMYVARKTDDGYRIVAGMAKEEVGGLVRDPTEREAIEWSRDNGTVIFETRKADGRHWLAVRSLTNEGGYETGVLLTDVSMASIDRLLSQRIRVSYFYLAIIVLMIIFMLVRQARVIDYMALYRRLKEVDQMKDDFISMAAHELRTPLTIIRGYASMLRERKRLPKRDTLLIDRIMSSVEQLHMLIGDILDVARLQQGRMSFEFTVIRVAEVIAEVVDSFRPVAEEKGLHITFEDIDNDALVKVDPSRFKQVLINIVGNAVKYTREGGITVTISRSGGSVAIRVSDTGIGMTEQEREHLFERFYRVKNKETQEIRGTGLGLWISKQIVEHMHGTISVESIKGKGTDFVISFPEERDGTKTS